jgi:hypothetical protein
MMRGMASVSNASERGFSRFAPPGLLRVAPESWLETAVEDYAEELLCQSDTPTPAIGTQ